MRAHDLLVAAAKEFVRKVEAGEARSVRSYAAFKEALEAHAAEQEAAPTKTPKLDAKFYGDIRKVKDDTRVPDDEYVVFLAKDNAFAGVLDKYLDNCLRLGADSDQIQAVKRMKDRVHAWRAANPDRCKVPDATGEKLLDMGA